MEFSQRNILYNHRTQGHGVERVHIMGLVDSWRAAGHQVDICSPPGVDIEHQEIDTTGKDGNKKTKSFLGTLASRLPEFLFELLEVAYNIWAWQTQMQMHRIRSYDFVYERYAFLNLAGLVVARSKRTPFVLEVNFTTETILVRHRTRFAQFLERWVEKRLFRGATSLVVVSTRLKELIVSSGVDANKIIVLPNAASPGKFDPTRNPVLLRQQLGLQERQVIGFVGYFYHWHGLELLLDTFERVKKVIPQVCYLLVGDGPERSRIAEWVVQRGWQHDILLPGTIAHDLIPDYIALFDIATMPDSNDYGSPMKIAEYMAMGKPIIAPRLGPIEDMVEDGVTGLLFSQRDVSDLSNKLISLLKNHEIRIQMGKAARNCIEERLNWDKVAEDILGISIGTGENIRGYSK